MRYDSLANVLVNIVFDLFNIVFNLSANVLFFFKTGIFF